MNSENRDSLVRIFSDAHVVDIDLSEWDKDIHMWVLADHYENWTNRCPLVIITFHNPSQVHLKYPFTRRSVGSDDKSAQWRIDTVDLNEDLGRNVRILLSGSSSSPILEVDCSEISFRKYSSEKLDQFIPGWNRPYSGFIRPGIEKLMRVIHP